MSSAQNFAYLSARRYIHICLYAPNPERIAPGLDFQLKRGLVFLTNFIEGLSAHGPILQLPIVLIKAYFRPTSSGTIVDGSDCNAISFAMNGAGKDAALDTCVQFR